MAIDYKAANAQFKKQKGALTRATKKGPEAVIEAVAKAKAEWNDPDGPFDGAWPDDWARWERAADDAQYALARARGSW